MYILAPSVSRRSVYCTNSWELIPDAAWGGRGSEGYSKHSHDYCLPVFRGYADTEAEWRPVNPSRCTRWRKVVSQLYSCCSDVGNDTRCGLGRLGERRKQWLYSDYCNSCKPWIHRHRSGPYCEPSYCRLEVARFVSTDACTLACMLLHVCCMIT